MAQTYKTDGIILSRTPHRDNDKLVRIFTREYGKLTARAISARKISSKLSGHLEPFIHADFHIARSKTIDIIAGSNTIDAHATLRTSLKHAAMAGFFSEIVDRFTHSHHEEPELYEHMHNLFTWLNANQPNVLVLYAGIMQLYATIGFYIEWYHCHSCKQPISPELNKFHFGLWNIECGTCSSTEETMPLSVPAIKILRFITEQPFDRVHQLVVSEEEWKEVHQFVDAVLRYHIDQPLISQQVLVDVL